MWECHVKLSSNIIPRKLNSLTCSILVSLIHSCNLRFFMLRWRWWKINIFVFLALSDNLLRQSQSVITFSSELIAWVASSILLRSEVKVQMGSINDVSSAYRVKWNFFVTWEISFIYMMNRRGPRMDPCGTPVEIVEYAEVEHTVFYFPGNFQTSLKKYL